jgi:hypothetical protein
LRAGAREGDVVLVTAADALPLLGEFELAVAAAAISSAIAFCKRASVARNQLLATSAARRLACVLGVERGRVVLRRRRGALGAHAAPVIQLPVGEDADALQAARIAAQRAAAARQGVDLGVERGARRLDVARGLLDARRRDHEVRVVRERLAHHRFELRIVERGEPGVTDGAGGRGGLAPFLGDLEIRQCLRGDVLARGRWPYDTPGERGHQRREEQAGRTHLSAA